MPITTVASAETTERRHVARRLRFCASKKLSRSRGPAKTAVELCVAILFRERSGAGRRAQLFELRVSAPVESDGSVINAQAGAERLSYLAVIPALIHH